MHAKMDEEDDEMAGDPTDITVKIVDGIHRVSLSESFKANLLRP